MAQKTADDVIAYFKDLHECTVASSGPNYIRLTDIPASGGSSMLPGGFGALEVLDNYWGEHEIQYTDAGTDDFGREQKDCVIYLN